MLQTIVPHSKALLLFGPGNKATNSVYYFDKDCNCLREEVLLSKQGMLCGYNHNQVRTCKFHIAGIVNRCICILFLFTVNTVRIFHHSQFHCSDLSTPLLVPMKCELQM